MRELLVDLLASSSSLQTMKEGAEKFKAKLEGVPQAFMVDLIFGLYTNRDIDYGFSLREDYGEEVRDR